MLRLIVLVLLLANGVYFAWSHDFLKMYGFGPVAPNEPHRMEQQIKPEMIQLLSAGDLKKTEAVVQADQAPKECLQAGPFDDEQLASVRKALEAALPGGSWQIETTKEAARWIVYMGKYASADLQAKKRAELAGLGIKADTVASPELQPGLVLASFDSEASAKAELTKLAPQGVRTARVVRERDAAVAHQVKLSAVSEAVKAKLPELKPALGARVFKTCS
nr:SPOR domain-containing protein [uncultured Rhodoferax sp.]